MSDTSHAAVDRRIENLTNSDADAVDDLAREDQRMILLESETGTDYPPAIVERAREACDDVDAILRRARRELGADD